MLPRRFAIATLLGAAHRAASRRATATPVADACLEDAAGAGREPARAVLRSPSGACQIAGRVGYCWSCGSGAACADGGGGAPERPLELVAGETAPIRLDHIGRIVRLEVEIWRGSSPSTGPLDVEPASVRPLRATTLRRPIRPALLTDGLEAGDYTIDIEITARGRCAGNTSEAFRIRVIDPPPIVTPAAATPELMP